MPFENLSNENIMLYLTKAYDKPNMLLSEFKDDMKRFNYIKRLFQRYRKYGELREQLVLNHLVVLYNVFGPEVVTRSLFFKVPSEDHHTLKTYLIFLNMMPNIVRGVRGRDIKSSDIGIDNNVANSLRNIK